MSILAISGRKRSGKSTLALGLAERLIASGERVACLAFAEPIKRIAVEILGLPREAVYGSDDLKENTLTSLEDHTGRPMNVRRVLQTIGTDFRDRWGSDVWVESLFRKMDGIAPGTVVVIDDLRYRNEAEALKEKGAFLVRLTRGRGGDPHPSETDLDDWKGFDTVVPADLDAAATLDFVWKGRCECSSCT